MASPTLTDKEIERQFGRRVEAQPLFEPCEWGYKCPERHRGSDITWSEFKEHIWCRRCQLDYPSKDCFLQRPSWMTPKAFKDFLKKLPFEPKVLPGVDHYLELIDKKAKQRGD